MNELIVYFVFTSVADPDSDFLGHPICYGSRSLVSGKKMTNYFLLIIKNVYLSRIRNTGSHWKQIMKEYPLSVKKNSGGILNRRKPVFRRKQNST